MKRIYPEIDFRFNQVKTPDGVEYVVTLDTYLRKQHTDGKWYKTQVFQRYNGQDTKSLNHSINSFHENLYLAQLFGRVIPDIKSADGSYHFELDDDQRSEEERLRAERQIK